MYVFTWMRWGQEKISFVYILSLFSLKYLSRCGDEILEINETSVQNTTLNEVYAVLSHCDPGAVQIIVSRHPEPQVAQSVFFLNFNIELRGSKSWSYSWKNVDYKDADLFIIITAHKKINLRYKSEICTLLNRII